MATPFEELSACLGLQWDEGNADKNWQRHRVRHLECEEVFFARPLVAAADPRHSAVELRYYVLGQTARGRRLFIACTIRDQLIRVISARAMSPRERRVNDETSKESAE